MDETEPRTFVYFFRAETTGLIKIGVTRHLEKRLRALELASGDRLDQLYAFPADRKMEQWLHRHFAAERKHGEWFRPSRRILDFLKWARAEVLARLDGVELMIVTGLYGEIL